MVFAYLVLNSWWQCVHSAFVSFFSWKCSQTELLFTFFLCTISSARYFLLPQLYSHYHSTFSLKIFNLYWIHTDFQIYVWTSRISQRYCSTAYTIYWARSHTVLYTSGHRILRIRVPNNFTGGRNWTVYIHIL